MVAVDGPLPQIDWTAADEWRVVLTVSGAPCGDLRLPNPGAGATPRLVQHAVLDHGRGAWIRSQTIASLRRRMGNQRGRVAPPLRCSVAICTHQRPQLLERALASLSRVDPQPYEILVVDSAPGDRPAVRTAAAAGARYVLVEHPGLNRARRAAIEQATGDVVVFADDDCVVSPGWLARLPELFADPAVGGVTGPVLAWRLDTPARRRRELVASLNQGFEPRRWDWRTVRPVGAGRVGAGANLAVRRSALLEGRPALPDELDVGTPARSGGDLYLLFCLLADGWGVVYDPATYLFHDHQPDAASLRATVASYGIGSAAFLTRTLVADRELAALWSWTWPWQRYRSALRRRAGGAGDATEQRLFALYAFSSLLGPERWLRSRRTNGRSSSGIRAAVRREPVLIPRCEHLTLVVDAAPSANGLDAALVGLREAAPGAEVLVSSADHVAAPSRDVVLIWDPGCVAEPGSLAAHVAAHAGGLEQLALGSWTRPDAPRSLASQWTALLEADRARNVASTATRTLGDVGSGNLSMPRETYERLAAEGPLPCGAASLHLASRALAEGVPLIRIDARARRTENPSHRELLDRSVARGRADAALLALHPGAVGALDGAGAPTIGERAIAPLLATAAGRQLAAVALGLLDRFHARLLWARLHRLTQRASHSLGMRQEGAAPPAVRHRPTQVVAVDGHEALERPTLATPRLELRLAGRRVTRIEPPRGQWSQELADRIVDEVSRSRWARRRREWWRALPVADAVPENRPPHRVVVIASDQVPALGEVEGVRVEIAGAIRTAGWRAVDHALQRADETVAVVVLPGAQIDPAALAALIATIGADRIALGLAGAARAGDTAGPLSLGDGNMWRSRFPLLGRPARCVVLATEAYRTMGFDGGSAHGMTAAVLDLADHALRQGWVVGHQELPDLVANHALHGRGISEARRWHARGALLMREARTRSPAGRLAYLIGTGLSRIGEPRDYGPRALLVRAVKVGAVGLGALTELRRATRVPPST